MFYIYYFFFLKLRRKQTGEFHSLDSGCALCVHVCYNRACWYNMQNVSIDNFVVITV